MMLFILIHKSEVRANTYDIYFGTNANETLKSGDIVELYAGISAVYPGEEISSQKLLFILNRNIFDIITDEKVPMISIRNGWKQSSFGINQNQFSIDVSSLTDEYNITNDLASGNSLDDINEVLVTAKLKVKRVSNQSTKIQLINEHNYVKELNFTIHNLSSNNYLSSIDVQGYQLNSKFDKNKTEYNVYVPYETEKVNISASLEDISSSLENAGEKTYLLEQIALI